MIKEIKSDSGKTYKVDTDKVTCSCADWQYRRRHYPNGSIDHLCKHLRALLEEDPKLFPSEYHQKKDEFDENAVVMDDKVRYPRVMFDSYVKSLKLLAKGGSVSQLTAQSRTAHRRIIDPRMSRNFATHLS